MDEKNLKVFPLVFDSESEIPRNSEDFVIVIKRCLNVLFVNMNFMFYSSKSIYEAKSSKTFPYFDGMRWKALVFDHRLPLSLRENIIE